jgi:ABC-type nitrate/sulfonate/bicarbonate transport system ATPase subunit
VKTYDAAGQAGRRKTRAGNASGWRKLLRAAGTGALLLLLDEPLGALSGLKLREL